ncbi:MAG: LppX_LprAFG lipoprotein [Candidatus Leucobacter sulfamidivorax]|nr:LppX_LprAFG lipoprotein [Candidatus Leucobacter sulfamidivorax]
MSTPRAAVSPVSVALTAVLMTTGLGLAGCATQAPAAEGPATSSAAEQTPGESPGSGAEPLTAEDFAERVTAAQLRAGMVHTSQTIEDASGRLTAEGDMTVTADPASVRVAVTMNGPNGASEVRIVDGVMYMNLSALSGDRFMVFEGGDGGSGLTADAIIGQLAPQTQLSTFGASIREFAVGGTEQLDGVRATQYTLVLDTATLLGGPLTSWIDPALVGETVQYEMWVGDDDLPRRAIMTFPGQTSTTDYSRWGQAVDIQAPSPDQIG